MKYCIGIIGRSCHKYHFCHDKSFVTTKICLPQQVLSWQNIFVMTNTKVLSWQAYFCCDKRWVLSWRTHVYCDKHISVVTKFWLRQNYVCRDKTFVMTKYVFCHDKHVFCHDKHVFVTTKLVATKIILVAAPAHDTFVYKQDWYQYSEHEKLAAPEVQYPWVFKASGPWRVIICALTSVLVFDHFIVCFLSWALTAL